MNAGLPEWLERNDLLISQFAELGDELTTPRPVDHLVTVPRRRADALCADLRAHGFEVTDRTRGLLRVGVEFSRIDAIDAESAENFVRQILDIADRHGADYDGWAAWESSADAGS